MIRWNLIFSFNLQLLTYHGPSKSHLSQQTQLHSLLLEMSNRLFFQTKKSSEKLIQFYLILLLVCFKSHSSSVSRVRIDGGTLKAIFLLLKTSLSLFAPFPMFLCKLFIVVILKENGANHIWNLFSNRQIEWTALPRTLHYWLQEDVRRVRNSLDRAAKQPSNVLSKSISIRIGSKTAFVLRKSK